MGASSRSVDRCALTLALGLTLALVLFACRSAAPAPDWVAGLSPAEYPPEAFLVAVGTGADLEEAGANAKAELARIFSAEIVSSLSLSETERMEGARSRTVSDLWVETRIDSRNQIEGAEIARHWSRNAAPSPRVWALVVLEKGPECRRIREAAKRWTAEPEASGSSAASAPMSPLRSVQEAERALARGRALSDLAARSRVLGRLCVPLVRAELSALERELRAAQARNPVRVRDRGQRKRPVDRPAKRRRLAARGARRAARGEPDRTRIPGGGPGGHGRRGGSDSGSATPRTGRSGAVLA